MVLILLNAVITGYLHCSLNYAEQLPFSQLNRDTGVLGLKKRMLEVLSSKVVNAVLGHLIKIIFELE